MQMSFQVSQKSPCNSFKIKAWNLHFGNSSVCLVPPFNFGSFINNNDSIILYPLSPNLLLVHIYSIEAAFQVSQASVGG
jgi:hypothetical protein